MPVSDISAPSASDRRIGAKRSTVVRVAIAGLGAVGRTVAERLDQGMPGLHLVAVSARDRTKAAARVAGFENQVPVEQLDRLPRLADVIVECLPAAVFREIAEPTLDAGRTLIAVSGGALLANPDLVERARNGGGRIIVPTGALIGLDAVQAAAQGTIHSVKMVTRKPPRGLAGAPFVVEHDIKLDGLSEPLKIFEGSARDAVRGFPANVNVAAALSLAGIGADRTMVEVWADPALDRNFHTIEVDSDSAQFTMSIKNIPSDENPKTGRITALSVIAALRKQTAALQIGT
jgi:aspartate dehydrogenase